MNRILILAALALLSLPAYSELYKWVDSQGKVHYSDTPPPGGAQRAKTLQAPPPGPAAPAAVPSGGGARSIAEQELEFKKRQVEAAEKQAKADEEAKVRRINCDRAQSNLRTFQDGGRLFNYNASGERQYIDDAAREAGIRKGQEEVAKWCN